MIKYCPWAKRSKRRRYRFRKINFSSMFMIMTFHLMEIVILKEVDRISIETKVPYLIDSHVLVYLTIK